MLVFRILALIVAFFLGFLTLIGALPVLFAVLAFSGWTVAAWLGVWLMFVWFFWRLIAFAFELKGPRLIKSPRAALVIAAKLVLSAALIWLFWLGPFAPWEVVLYAPHSTQIPGSIKRGEYFISYQACQKALMAEIAKQTPATFATAPEDIFSIGYCGQGCGLNTGGVAESMSCYQTWGAREL